MTPDDILRKAQQGGGGTSTGSRLSVAEEAPKLRKPVDWSRIGRKSRRKGKGFECEIAACLRQATGCDWQTTRNSGRTDLGGDIYTPNGEYAHVQVECKNRKSFSMRDIVWGNKGFVDEINNVLNGWADRGEVFLVIVIRTDVGLWVAAERQDVEGGDSFRANYGAVYLVDTLGNEWSHIGHTTRFESSPVVEQLICWLGRGSTRPA